jgi:hypothetical protein
MYFTLESIKIKTKLNNETIHNYLSQMLMKE